LILEGAGLHEQQQQHQHQQQEQEDTILVRITATYQLLDHIDKDGSCDDCDRRDYASEQSALRQERPDGVEDARHGECSMSNVLSIAAVRRLSVRYCVLLMPVLVPAGLKCDNRPQGQCRRL